MTQIYKEWLEFAKSDMKNAEILFTHNSYKDSIWYCHQAIEKLLKAILSNQGKTVRKTHDLIGLLEETNVNYQKSLSTFLEELNPYYIPTRYPEAGFTFKITYSKTKARKIFLTTKEVFKWLRIELNHKK